MKIIEQVIATTEKKLKDKLDKIQKSIDFDPFLEAIAINKETFKLFNSPITNFKDYEQKLKSLKDRAAKNKRDVNRVLKPNYSEKLYEQKREIENQLRELMCFKTYVFYKE